MSIRQIARLAQVSACTVSLALRNDPKISVGTRRKVAKIAKRLGYKPNAKINQLMSELRLSRKARIEACFGVISFYDSERPWEEIPHLQRIYQGMHERTEALGYRLEPLWLRAPGMTYRRFRSVLDVRRVEGLLCLGSPDIDEDFPLEFDHYAIVTQGTSIRTPLHRVVNHAYNNIWRALDKLYGLGYRRPGLVIGHYLEQRSAHAYLSAYLGWNVHVLGTYTPIPVLKIDRVEEEPLLAWLERYQPDVLVFAHLSDFLPDFEQVLHRRGLRVPEELGVAVVSQSLRGTKFSGLQENQDLIGAWAVELLVSRVMNRDFGIPKNPRIEMIESKWIDGKSLRFRHVPVAPPVQGGGANTTQALPVGSIIVPPPVAASTPISRSSTW